MAAVTSIAAAAPVPVAAAKIQSKIEIRAGGRAIFSEQFDDDEGGDEHAGKHLPGITADEDDELDC